LVEEGDQTRRIGRVDSDRKGVEQFAEAVFDDLSGGQGAIGDRLGEMGRFIDSRARRPVEVRGLVDVERTRRRAQLHAKAEAGRDEGERRAKLSAQLAHEFETETAVGRGVESLRQPNPVVDHVDPDGAIGAARAADLDLSMNAGWMGVFDGVLHRLDDDEAGRRDAVRGRDAGAGDRERQFRGRREPRGRPEQLSLLPQMASQVGDPLSRSS